MAWITDILLTFELINAYPVYVHLLLAVGKSSNLIGIIVARDSGEVSTYCEVVDNEVVLVEIERC